jgi:hypothetical protein
MKNNENTIRENLENNFNKLLPDDDAPKELKEEVFGTIETLNFLGDLADLFTVKFSQAETLFLDILHDDTPSE